VIEEFRIFRAAKVFSEKQFVQGNDLRTARGGLADFVSGAREILVRVRGAFHLHESDRKFASHEIQFSMSTKENICARFVVSFARRL